MVCLSICLCCLWFLSSMSYSFLHTGFLSLSVQFSSVHFSLSVMSDSLRPHESQHARPPCPSPAPGVGSLSLLQGIFQTQGLNPGLPHCRQILYQLSHKGSPRILEWVAYPFSSRSSQSRNQTGVFRTAGGFFTS